MKVKNNLADYKDWYTINQLYKKDLAPADTDKLERMWTNQYCGCWYEYCHISNTRPITAEEKKVFEDKIKAQKKVYRENHKKNLQKKIEAEKQEYDRLYDEKEAYRKEMWTCQRKAEEIARILFSKIRDTMIVPEYSGNKTIVIDTETTGLEENAEILQLSIIDDKGNTIIDKRYKPIYTVNWEDAEKVHGISKDDVKECPYILDDIPFIQAVINNADTVIGYNVGFDIGKLENVGINFQNIVQIYDVMRNFAEIYGEWNDYYKDFKWQKLSTCANYYGYEFKAHDSLEDCRATLFCYNHICKEETE